MGLDLTLAPIRHDTTSWWLCNLRLRLDRCYDLFDKIAEFPKYPTEGKKIDWYNDEGIEKITTDPYGEPLHFVHAIEFRKIDTESLEDWNKSMIKFIQGLPPLTPIVIYWC